MMVLCERTSKVRVTVEAKLPLHGKLDVGHEHEAWIYKRRHYDAVKNRWVVTEIQVGGLHDVAVKTQSWVHAQGLWNVSPLTDWDLGLGEYVCSPEEFAAALQKARAVVASIDDDPGNAEPV